ncbi:glutamate racemase [Nitrosopumilus oxyclinae]|uniref:Glutamate racemase n=1 Tax=Nitrosopumilus oxyclinae TaxID=1959104 RepID=A0A7D5M0H5_9ARCH|nr:aspartate/glutamate racemase family protein [Nitrosopumilus oxyclinae]QLH03934.1 glutamate racemase [Nitrosopumilus oxyclinae]
MVKIVVFDSGLGSLSIIKAIQKISKSEIIYFADQENFPYGEKSQAQLSKIIKNSIKLLDKEFSPNFIVVASNTPSLMLNLTSKKIIDVKPPLKEALKLSKTKQIGILATKSAIVSNGLTQYIKENNFSKKLKIFKINGSDLVDLVESGKFISNKKYCNKIIKKILEQILFQNNIDTITLSSTHLLFLKSLLKKQFPKINFVDPSEIVAKKILLMIKNNQSKKNSLKIFATGDTKIFELKLNKLGIKNKVNLIPF